MEGPISESVKKRLPVAIQRLDETHQRVYIWLRLRKREEEIVRLLGESLDAAREKIRRVRDELAREGKLDLVNDPVFIPMHVDDESDRTFSLISSEPGVEEWAMLRELARILKSAFDSIPARHGRLLTLKYNHGMSANEIVEFCKASGEHLLSKKETGQAEVREIRRELSLALAELLKALKQGLKGEGDRIGTKELKDILEGIGEI